MQYPKGLQMDPSLVMPIDLSLFVPPSIRLSVLFAYVYQTDISFRGALMKFGKSVCFGPSMNTIENVLDRITFSITRHIKITVLNEVT